MYRLLATVLAAAAGAPVAASLVVGAGSGLNTFPFGGSVAGPPSTTYQQVYAASSFSGSPYSITSIAFRFASGLPATGTFTLSLSTTTAAVDALDTVDLLSNIGSDNTQIFAGSLAGDFADKILSFTFAPFSYDPTAGNLLFNVESSDVGAVSGAIFADDGNAGGVYSRAHDFGSGFAGYGLQTFFNYAEGEMLPPAGTIPEPATWSLMMIGLGLTGCVLRWTGSHQPPRCG